MDKENAQTGELRNGLLREKASHDANAAFCNNSPVAEANPILPSNALSPEDTVKYLHLMNQKMQQQHEKEIVNMNLAMLKVRESLEQDKRRTLAEFWKQADIEKQKAITQIKKNCVECGKTTKTKTILNSVPSSFSLVSRHNSLPSHFPSIKSATIPSNWRCTSRFSHSVTPKSASRPHIHTQAQNVTTKPFSPARVPPVGAEVTITASQTGHKTIAKKTRL